MRWTRRDVQLHDRLLRNFYSLNVSSSGAENSVGIGDLSYAKNQLFQKMMIFSTLWCHFRFRSFGLSVRVRAHGTLNLSCCVRLFNFRIDPKTSPWLEENQDFSKAMEFSNIFKIKMQDSLHQIIERFLVAKSSYGRKVFFENWKIYFSEKWKQNEP